jgi:membrane glycosyltransferase
MPEISRVSMIPSRIERYPLRRLWRAIFAAQTPAKESGDAALARVNPPEAGPFQAAWRAAAKRRRLLLALLVVAQTAIASWSLARIFPGPALSGLEVAIVANFAALFSWISFSFWANVAGFFALWRNGKFYRVGEAAGEPTDQPLGRRTALVMPICNEDVTRCFDGLEAIYRSVAATGQIEGFDFYILSDTGEPERQVEEEMEWARLCRALSGFGRIYYRHRRNNIKRKSGNIADFLRRWGQRYDYMIVLDADSIMSGEILTRLVRLMDRSPHVGIIQTVPNIFNGDSLFARVQQFASRCYGPLLSASLHFWQLGESYYWGHNAILRVAPFVKHCGLARLPGPPPLGGEILSHDFVEAALMGRAGWEVWLACDLPGSYEESPPTLLDELKRDRRWCQGNLQHLRLLLGDRFKAGHRAILGMGVMAYASALLWLSFLVLNTVEFGMQSLIPPVYFPAQRSLFPIWPQWRPEWAIALIGTTAVLLILPKLLSLLLILKNRQTHQFGGLPHLCASMLLEIIVSTLLAPVRMWFHSKFVFLTLLGRRIKWTAQCRTGNATGWLEAIRAHGCSTLFATAWIACMAWLNPVVCLGLLPVALSLLVSIPVSVASSWASLGDFSRRWRLFQIPEEYESPRVINGLRAALDKRQRKKSAVDGFAYASLDPVVNLVHVEMLRGRAPKPLKTRERNRSLRELALEQGPAKLSRLERAYLLKDAESMTLIHREICHARDPEIPRKWGIPFGYRKTKDGNTRLNQQHYI